MTEQRTDPGRISGEAAGTIREVRRRDPDYPPVFRCLPGMPESLYVLGDLPDPGRRSIAIVGARACSRYGRSEAVRFADFFAANGVQVISGMAAGIDSAAHEGALQAGGRTFAVLGCGVDRIYPKSSGRIYRQMILQGGILSEYSPGTPPLALHFPIRNRIISALSDIVLVIEARKKSGSLITADRAIEMGKTVYALPGRSTDALSEGTNYLIAQGAGIAYSPEAVLDELYRLPPYSADILIEGKDKKKGSGKKDRKAGEKPGRIEPAPPESGLPDKFRGRGEPEYERVYQSLSILEKSLIRIVDETGLPVARVSRILLEFCLAGVAEEVDSGFFCRSIPKRNCRN